MLSTITSRLLTHRTLTTTLPSTGAKIRYRPMASREEKLLLMAKDGEDQDEIMSTVMAVVQNCVLDNFEAAKAPIFDIEWLFIKIRAASISNVVPVSYIDHSDERRYDFEVELDDVTVIAPEVKKAIDLGEGISVTLRWPTVEDILAAHGDGSDSDDTTDLMAIRSIDSIFDGDKVIPASEVPLEELVEFRNAFPLKAEHELLEFLTNMPALNYTIEYRNSKGEERKVVLNKLTDFFTFR